MVVATGKSILNRIGIGKIKIYKAPTYDIYDGIVEDPAAEVARFEEALQKAIDQQGILYEKAKKDAGEESAGIFEFLLGNILPNFHDTLTGTSVNVLNPDAG